RAVGRVDVRKGAAGAVATDPTGAAGPARGLVGREGTVAQQEHGPTYILNTTAAGIGAHRAPGTADGLVRAEGTLADAEEGQAGNADIHEGAAFADPAVGTAAAGAADRPVGGERPVADGRGGVGFIEPPAGAAAAGLARAAVAGDRLVVGERTVADDQDSAGGVKDAAAAGEAARAAEGLVVRQGAVGDGQGAGGVDPAPILGLTLADRQAVGERGDAAADLEDPAGALAADGQLLGARAGDHQTVGDA